MTCVCKLSVCGISCLNMGQDGCMTSSSDCCPLDLQHYNSSCTTSCPSSFDAMSIAVTTSLVSIIFTLVVGFFITFLSCAVHWVKIPSNADCNGWVAAHVCETRDYSYYVYVVWIISGETNDMFEWRILVSLVVAAQTSAALAFLNTLDATVNVRLV